MLPAFLTRKIEPLEVPKEVFLPVESRIGILQVRVRRNKRAKRYTLRIANGSHEPVITIPRNGSLVEAQDFIKRQADWLAERLEGKQERRPLLPGTIVPFKGHNTRLEPSGKLRGTVEFLESEPQNIAYISGDAAHFERRVQDWLKREAKKALLAASLHHANNLGLKFSSLSVRDQRTRWGSCSSSGSLNYSWRLILAPHEVLDYVAAHEVAHLKEMNHGPRFWALVEETCPDMQIWRNWLREHGSNLHLYG